MNKRIEHTTDIRVRYAETDAMTFVYHGNYLIYFENARTELLRFLGLPYSEVETMGIFVVVLEAHIHFHRPARYDDLLHVRAMVNEMPSSRFRIHYEITRNGEREVLVSGETVHTFLRKTDLRPTRPPKEFIDIMAKHFKDLHND